MINLDNNDLDVLKFGRPTLYTKHLLKDLKRTIDTIFRFLIIGTPVNVLKGLNVLLKVV